MNKLSLNLLLACTLFCANCVSAQDAKEPPSHPDAPASSASYSQPKAHIVSDKVRGLGSIESDAHFFKLAFVIEEKDGAHVVDRREYRLDMDSEQSSNASLRSGDRVPILTTEKGEPKAEYQYLDMGVSIDAKDAQLVSDAVAVNVSIKVLHMPDMPAGETSEKIIRNQQWSSRVLASLNKPTVIFSSDDPNSTHSFTVTLTPTLLR